MGIAIYKQEDNLALQPVQRVVLLNFQNYSFGWRAN